MNRPNKNAPAWWRLFLDAIDRLPPSQQAVRLAGLAKEMVARGEKRAAAPVAARAWRQYLETKDRSSEETIRQALSAVTPGYHVQISTDADRLGAWEAALKDVVRPGMLVLEVGAGSGILAMLAARAGARVVSCENNSVMAAIAEHIVRKNGFADAISIVAKPVFELNVLRDLPRAADLLLLDVFADDFFGFRPFEIIRAAKRLLQPGGVVMPMRVSLDGALAEFRRWHRIIPGRVAGFELDDLGQLSRMRTSLDANDPDLVLRSSTLSLISATPPDDLPEANGVVERIFASSGGPVNGLVLWLRLDLAPGHVLQARPGVASRGFYAKPRFFAFSETIQTERDAPCAVSLRWEDKQVYVSQTGR